MRHALLAGALLAAPLAAHAQCATTDARPGIVSFFAELFGSRPAAPAVVAPKTGRSFRVEFQHFEVYADRSVQPTEIDRTSATWELLSTGRDASGADTLDVRVTFEGASPESWTLTRTGDRAFEHRDGGLIVRAVLTSYGALLDAHVGRAANREGTAGTPVTLESFVSTRALPREISVSGPPG